MNKFSSEICSIKVSKSVLSSVRPFISPTAQNSLLSVRYIQNNKAKRPSIETSKPGDLPCR